MKKWAAVLLLVMVLLPVTVKVKARDRYGRLVGKVYRGELYVNLEIIKAGFAWHYKKYSRDKNLAAAERDARAAKIGLWSAGDPTPPWNFRRKIAAANFNHN